jgi:hypothetical protein
LFPGLQQSYINALQQSGINTAALNTLTQAATTGLPTDVGPAFDAFKAAAQQTIQQGAAGLQERLGAGMATGSDLVKGQSEYAEQTSKDLTSQLAQWSMAASEAAAQRRVGAATTGAQLVADPALAFRQTGVVTQQPGILGGAASLFKALFPNFDLQKILFPEKTTTYPSQYPVPPTSTERLPFGGGTLPPEFYPGAGGNFPFPPAYDPTGSSNVNLDYSTLYPGQPGYVDPYSYPPPDLPDYYGGGGGGGGDLTDMVPFA